MEIKIIVGIEYQQWQMHAMKNDEVFQMNIKVMVEWDNMVIQNKTKTKNNNTY